MIASDSRGAWTEIEARLRPWVARRVAPSDVDDVVQEVFLRIHQKEGQLRDGERFGAWVYRIAAHAVADQLRVRQKHPIREECVLHADDPEEDLEIDECIALFVARLPSPYREAITLTELEGLTQKDAAEMLGLSLSGMKSRVQRGRDQIRRMFEQCCVIAVDARGKVIECTPRAEAIPDDCREAAARWAERHVR